MKFASIFSRQLSKLAKSQSKHTIEENESLIDGVVDLSDAIYSIELEQNHTVQAPLVETENEPVKELRPASECDPALACRKFVINDKPIRPIIKFPETKKRKFLKSWYAEYAWVEYSIFKDAAFCFPCRKFENRINSNADKAFVTTCKLF